jgi:alkanesulfonate monooxygenase SsuD/methylene tetrahydromethanopterin reductase-like flavin-dependent oxidoreductase (luciferase family)
VVRVGFSLPFRHKDGSAPKAAEVAAVAAAIEQAGFDGIWLADTVARGREARPDPLMWLVVVGMATRRIELGTAVLQVPIRGAVELAQRFLTIHALFPGRFSAGVGAGSSPADFASVGVDFGQRFHLLDEGLRTIRALGRGEVVGSADLKPWPNVLPGPPLLIGSWVSPLWIRRAAHEFDGWLTSGGGPGGTNFRNLKDGIKLYRSEGGGRAIVATVGVDLDADSPPLSDESRFSLRCPPHEAVARIEQVAELGYDDVLLRDDELNVETVWRVAEALRLPARPASDGLETRLST